jgi:hypothetical protein
VFIPNNNMKWNCLTFSMELEVIHLCALSSSSEWNRPLFSAHFLFLKFIDQHKGRFCDLVPGDGVLFCILPHYHHRISPIFTYHKVHIHVLSEHVLHCYFRTDRDTLDSVLKLLTLAFSTYLRRIKWKNIICTS